MPPVELIGSGVQHKCKRASSRKSCNNIGSYQADENTTSHVDKEEEDYVKGDGVHRAITMAFGLFL